MSRDHDQNPPQLILASSSAARQHMLANAGFRFTAQGADLDERALTTRHLSSGLSINDLALVLANAKAAAVAASHPRDLVVGSDQVLVCDGEIFGKVTDLTQAARQLARLQGKTHTLISAVACWHANRKLFESSDRAAMKMYPLNNREIASYLAQAGPGILGSVGCYQIEAEGIRLFEEIDGSHFTIMGMPLLPLVKFLNQQKTLR